MEPKTRKLLINFITNNNALHKSNPIMLKLVSQVNFVFRFKWSFDIIGSLICMSHNLSQVHKRAHVLLSKDNDYTKTFWEFLILVRYSF